MVYASLSFGSGLTAPKALVAALCALPPALRPTHHSIGEDDVRQPIDEATALVRLLETGGSRFLWGRQVSYHVSPVVDLTCSAFFTKAASSQLVRAFIERVATLESVFGYACAWEELLHRNRLFVQIDGGKGGTSEDWVGRDHSKYVPGLYWLTLLPEALAERHGVPLAPVSAALEHVDLGGGQHLFRFHDHPADWRKRIDAIDDLCARRSGVFDIQEVRGLVAAKAAKSFAELDDVLGPWR